MAKRKPAKRKSAEERTQALLQELLEAVQDVFILQALKAGAQGKAIRALLQVDNWRITKVSKVLKSRRD